MSECRSVGVSECVGVCRSVSECRSVGVSKECRSVEVSERCPKLETTAPLRLLCTTTTRTCLPKVIDHFLVLGVQSVAARQRRVLL